MLWISAALAAGVGRAKEPGDPPSRVLRLNYLAGSVSFRPGDLDDWAPASLNYPITAGDHLWTDPEARMELHVGSTAVRMAGETAVAIVDLDDRTVQISVTQGSLNIRLRELDDDETFEIDTPSGAVSLLRPGDYRVDVDPDENSASVTVWAGEAEVTGGGQSSAVHAREVGRFQGADQLNSEVLPAQGPDRWDEWCRERDEREDRALDASTRYVPREMIGAEDLSSYGVWRDDPMYGPVWVPATVPVGWAPYRYGHWAYVEPWGWTWIDDAAWGFAPFHYGRWAYAGSGWCWVPGAVVARPVYSPALVAFIGGRDFSAAVGAGSGLAAWVPLGPHEVYRPPYRASEAYVQRVNVTHVTNITNVNVTNITYVNRAYVTAVPQATFAGAHPVAAAAVRVPPSAVARVDTVGVVSARAGRESMLGRPVQPGVRVAVPPARIIDRTVVVRTAPPQAVRPVGPVRVAPPVGESRAPVTTPPRSSTEQPRGYHPPQPNNEGPQGLPPRMDNDRPRVPNASQPSNDRPQNLPPRPNGNRPMNAPPPPATNAPHPGGDHPATHNPPPRVPESRNTEPQRPAPQRDNPPAQQREKAKDRDEAKRSRRDN